MITRLFEDIFDDDDTRDLITAHDERDGSSLSEAEPEFQVCWYLNKNEILLQELKPAVIRTLKSAMGSFRYIHNVRLMVSGNGIPGVPHDEPVNYFAECQKAGPLAPGQPTPDIIHVFFDYDTSMSENVRFMSNVLIDLMTMFVKFMSVYSYAWDRKIGMSYYVDQDDTEPQSQTIAKQLALNIQPDIYDIKKGNVNKDTANKMACIFETIGSSLTSDDILGFFNKQFKVSKTLLKAFYDMNVSTGLLRKIKVSEDSKKARRTIEIPEGVTVSFEGLNLRLLAKETKTEKLALQVDGTLIISSIEEFENLKFLSPVYDHNKLVVNMYLSMRMLRSLLCGAFFKEIDFSHCDLPDDVVIDMDYKLVQNKDMNIIPNTQMTLMRGRSSQD